MKKIVFLFIAHIFFLYSYDATKLENYLISHFKPDDESLTYLKHITIGGKKRKIYVFYTKILDYHSPDFTKKLDSSSFLLEELAHPLKYIYHITFGGRNPQILCFYTQIINIKNFKNCILISENSKKLVFLREEVEKKWPEN